MSHRTEANIRVDGFAIATGEGPTRLELPKAELAELRGSAGGLEYVATGLTFEGLQGRFDPMYWSAEGLTANGLVVHDRDATFELRIGRIEMTQPVMTRAAGGGVELMCPQATLSDVKLILPDLSRLMGPRPASEAPPPPAPGPTGLLQERLRFLDAVTGALSFRVKVVLDLPVIGKRTLDQPVRVDITDGTFDYRALDDNLNWLEGAFLDLGVGDGRFKVGWSVPLFSSNEIISWILAPDAQAQAAHNRIPLRVLGDVRIGGPTESGSGEASKGGGKKRLRSMTIADIDIGLSMVAPRSLEVGGGAILFGGEDAAGIVDLQIRGDLIHPPAPGGIHGRIGALDLTLKDVPTGGVVTTVDRLHLDEIEEVTVAFDGFTPTALGVTLRRVTATNLALVFG